MKSWSEENEYCSRHCRFWEFLKFSLLAELPVVVVVIVVVVVVAIVMVVVVCVGLKVLAFEFESGAHLGFVGRILSGGMQ